MWRRASVGLVLAATACAAEPSLPWPEVDGAVVWIVVASTPTTVRAEVLGPGDALHLETDGRVIEAIAFTRDLGVLPGPLGSSNQGELLPEPAGVFTADVDALTWRASTLSPAAKDLRLPRPDDDCPHHTARTYRLADDEPDGAQAIVRVDDDTRLLLLPRQWFVITRDEIRPIPPRLEGVHAVTREPSAPAGGDFVLSRGDELWSVAGSDLTTATATLARRLPPGLEPFALAAPVLGVVYGLTKDGRLFRSDTSTTVVVHRFSGARGTRGTVIVDGTSILAGVAPEGTLVSIDENRVKRIIDLPPPSEGVVSIARFAELGLVIGTNNGGLLSDRLNFQLVPDPLGQMPRGVPIHALEPYQGRLLFGGDSGVFGEITARRFVCTSPLPASATIRFLEPFGDQILAVGLPAKSGSGEVNLTRYTVQR